MNTKEMKMTPALSYTRFTQSLLRYDVAIGEDLLAVLRAAADVRLFGDGDGEEVLRAAEEALEKLKSSRRLHEDTVELLRSELEAIEPARRLELIA